MATTVELNFRGPFTRSQFFDTALEDANAPGVYIWGFDEGKGFKPYYVGKSQGKIGNRIARHLGDILKRDSTYMRLTEIGMKHYQDEFPIITRNARKGRFPNANWIGHPWTRTWPLTCKYIGYINNKEFLEKRYRKGGLDNHMEKDYTLKLINEYPDFKDVLKERIDAGKFRVCFAIPKYNKEELDLDHLDKKGKEHFYELLEATTKFSLKKITVGKSLPFADLSNSSYSIKITPSPVLQQLNIFNPNPKPLVPKRVKTFSVRSVIDETYVTKQS